MTSDELITTICEGMCNDVFEGIVTDMNNGFVPVGDWEYVGMNHVVKKDVCGNYSRVVKMTGDDRELWLNVYVYRRNDDGKCTDRYERSKRLVGIEYDMGKRLVLECARECLME